MTLTEADESLLIEIVRDAARVHIMPRFRGLSADAISAKSAADDLVTIADREAEAAMTEALSHGPFADALVVGEEAVEDDPSLPGQIADAACAVVLDPVDGTWSFAHGLATFGVILAVTVKGETIFGLLYDPVLDDWVMARKGGGTWFCRPGATPKQLLMPSSPSPAIGGFLPIRQFPSEYQASLAAEMIPGTRTTGLGCSCHEYRMMAMGHGLYCIGVKPKPWDHAAGVLAVTEAGGSAGIIGGGAYRPANSAGLLLSAQSEVIYSDIETRIRSITEDARP